MKAIILAAGYATRLFPLTENYPKPLLKVQGISILDRLIQNIEKIDIINEYIIVSNHKYISHFRKWATDYFRTNKTTKKITILDDGSTNNENRLGAVKDIFFAITQCSITDDVFVLAGDNILDFDLKSFVDYFKNKKSTCIMRHFEHSNEKLSKTGVITIDTTDKVVSMEEKPNIPKSNWAVPPFYIYPASALIDIRQGIESGCSTDAPGDFIAWYCQHNNVYAWEMTGNRYDIGTLDNYQFVQGVNLTNN